MSLFRYLKSMVSQERIKTRVCEQCHFRIVGKRKSCSTCGAYIANKNSLAQATSYSDCPPSSNALVDTEHLKHA